MKLKSAIALATVVAMLLGTLSVFASPVANNNLATERFHMSSVDTCIEIMGDMDFYQRYGISLQDFVLKHHAELLYLYKAGINNVEVLNIIITPANLYDFHANDLFSSANPVSSCNPCFFEVQARARMTLGGPDRLGCEFGVYVVSLRCRYCRITSGVFITNETWSVSHTSGNGQTSTQLVHGSTHPGWCQFITHTWWRCIQCNWLLNSQTTQSQPFWCTSPNIFSIDEYCHE